MPSCGIIRPSQTLRNNCFYAPHPFSLMGAFAGQLKASGLREDVFHRSVHSAAHLED